MAISCLTYSLLCHTVPTEMSYKDFTIANDDQVSDARTINIINGASDCLNNASRSIIDDS
jgi:hypothetical protein